jgi:protein SCO1
MSPSSPRAWTALAVLLALPFLMSAAPARADSRRTAPPPFPPGADQPLSALQDIDVIEHLGDRIPAGLGFRDPDGNKVELDALLGGKPLLVTLGYYRCPMLCNMVLESLAKASKQSGLTAGKDFQALSISIDPAEDAKLARETGERVRRAVGASDVSAWPFLMGDAFASRMLADAVGFKYVYDDTSKQFAHAAVAFVLTPSGKISRYLYGVEVSSRDFRLAMVEAGEGKVGTTLDRVLLSCFRYDPMSRKYAPFVMGFMRIGAGLAFICLATLLTVLWRKELVMRRKRAAA